MLNQDIHTKIIRSLSFDPWFNLALEEHLLNQIQPNEVIFYLWQNKDTVVIGKNQNAWKECRCKRLEEDGGKLARRLSGGGAVFHDLGNLNFTFIMDKNLYDLEKQLKVILNAVKSLGIDAKFSGRNDLTAKGKKFSGNAFYFREHSAYHHGTILINTDLMKLTNYLQVSKEKIASKGIDSVSSRVINLMDLQNNLTIDQMLQSLKQSFVDIYGGTTNEIQVDRDNYNIKDLYDKYASWEWRYGEAPKFDIVFENRFPWGGIQMGLSLKNGHITSAKIYSDAMNSKLIQKIASSLIGLPFDMNAILDTIKNIDTKDPIIITDIQNWLFQKSKQL
ncbi:lipoate--protein ligase [Crassaminicella thermophila]|uniref:lipoate--protein ligase n=1 Tax=Crassaminicella thermophila TaxID=2599308 RepID=A0A5C0SBT2_CRATE|nr:lipoate--protein ligase [Crassaminicella thermophila]QEK11372.1 lipoate--protein ligase [Crassaminicella thermophila]